MICVEIDELTPCLIDTKTGEIVGTEFVRIKRKSFLRKYNKKNGWYVNWADLADVSEIYALVIEGSVDIQGLLAISPSEDFRAMYILWMVASPHNNPKITDHKRFRGVGGHLFAKAIRESVQAGYGGDVFGFAANASLLKHYVDEYGAIHVGVLHQYHFMLVDSAAKAIVEEYTYEESEDEL